MTTTNSTPKTRTTRTAVRTRAALVPALALLAALAGPGRAQDGPQDGDPWAGAWNVRGRREQVRVDATPHGYAMVRVLDDGRACALLGAGGPVGLTLRGEVRPALGIVRALDGEELGDEAEPVFLRAERREGDDEVLAHVAVTRGRRTTQEVWSRPGPARLELVSVTHAGGEGPYDPVLGPLTVRLRVRGRPQQVRLEVRLAVGSLAEHQRRFYRAQGVRGDVVRTVSGGPLSLAVGEHDVTWDGRDETDAERLVLPGHYVLEARSEAPAVEPATADLSVVPPQALTVVSPSDDALDSPETSAAREMTLTFRDVGYRNLRSDGARPIQATRSAVVTSIATGRTTDWFDLEVCEERGFEGAPLANNYLRDTLAVFVYASDADEAFVRGLHAAGADVVVCFRAPVLRGQARPYHERLAIRLLDAGAPIEETAREAACFADEQAWSTLGNAVRAAADTLSGLWLLHRAPERLERAIVTSRACGIGPEESLLPARHGSSTN